MHLFVDCPVVRAFWKKLQEYVKSHLNFGLILSNFDIILGHLLSHQNKTPVNALILLTKKYIFDSFKNNTSLHLEGLKFRLKQFYLEEELLAILRNKHSTFKTTWERWQPVFRTANTCLKKVDEIVFLLKLKLRHNEYMCGSITIVFFFFVFSLLYFLALYFNVLTDWMYKKT